MANRCFKRHIVWDAMRQTPGLEPARLAERVGMTRRNVVAIVRAMARQGQVQRGATGWHAIGDRPKDTRGYLPNLTEEGRRLGLERRIQRARGGGPIRGPQAPKPTPPAIPAIELERCWGYMPQRLSL